MSPQKNRREFLRLSALAGLSVAASAPLSSLSAGDAAPAARPNLLLICVDDLRPQLGCYGRSFMRTPNIDRLAARGTLFERAYCNAPQCGPSRASLLSGLRPGPARFFKPSGMPAGYHPADIKTPHVTLPGYLKQNGYHTLSLGKVYHGFESDRESWSQPPWRPEQVVNQWHGPSSYASPAIRDQVTRMVKTGRRRAKGPATDRADIPDDALPDGKIASHAISELEGLKDGERPFFMALGFLRPHLPFSAPEKYWSLYDGDRIEMADNPFPPLKAPKQALHNWPELRAYSDIPRQGKLSDEKARQLVHGYYASVSYTDAQVGRVLDALDRLGLGDNTHVILWGDHGWNLREHGLWAKHSHFETSLHAPLIVRSPSRPGGRRTRALTEFVDVYPSICELAGLPLPAHLEGSSFVPLLDNPDREWKAAVFAQWRNDGQSVKTDRYRYTQWTSRQGKMTAEMLYDHENDPKENTNVATDEKYRTVLEEMRETIRKGWRAQTASASWQHGT